MTQMIRSHTTAALSTVLALASALICLSACSRQPSYQTPLRQGADIVIEIAGQTIANIYDYTFALELLKIGEPAKVVYMRDGQRRETTLTPGARK